MNHAPESAHYDSLTGISNEPNLYCEEIRTDEENSDTAVEAFDLTRERETQREKEIAWKASKLKCRQLERKYECDVVVRKQRGDRRKAEIRPVTSKN